MKEYTITFNILSLALVISIIVGIAQAYSHYKNTYDPKNPFIKVGSMATQNGVVAEVFEFHNNCFIVVQTAPEERGRGMIQMECR